MCWRIKPKVRDNESCGTDENQEVVSHPQQSDDKSLRGNGKDGQSFSENENSGGG